MYGQARKKKRHKAIMLLLYTKTLSCQGFYRKRRRPPALPGAPGQQGSLPGTEKGNEEPKSIRENAFGSSVVLDRQTGCRFTASGYFRFLTIRTAMARACSRVALA